MRINNDIFKLNAIELAPKLVGKILCRKTENGEIIKKRIKETECYYGTKDTACHAHKGKTPRNSIMYAEGGKIYVYLCYGIHILFNIVSGEEGHPEGVMIRGVDGIIGPGKVTKYFDITRDFYGWDIKTSNTIWVEDDGYIPKIKLAKRVGIGYASKHDQDILWRFIDDKK